jgi:hypothetical protein
LRRRRDAYSKISLEGVVYTRTSTHTYPEALTVREARRAVELMEVPMNCLMREIAVFSLWITAMAIAPNAHATFDGKITFRGAITAPTCALATSAVTAIESIPAAPTTTQCTSSGTATSVQYMTRIEPIADSERERLLSYFRDYLRAAQPAATPRLITNVYD